MRYIVGNISRIRVIIIVFVIFLVSCSNREKTVQMEAIVENEDVMDSFVDCQLVVKPLDIEQEYEKEQLAFSIIETIEYESYRNGMMKIIIEKIDSWYYWEDNDRIDWNDPGDFHRIKIEYKDTCYSFFNSGGWIKPKSAEFRYVPNFTKHNKIHSDYLVLTQNNEDFLLFAFGYVYASEPGLLSLINLSSPKPELIFNDNYMLSGYWENNPKITVTEYFPADHKNKHDTLLLINHRLQALPR